MQARKQPELPPTLMHVLQTSIAIQQQRRKWFEVVSLGMIHRYMLLFRPVQ